ncbi:MAG: hypothetical protein AAF160_04575 [Pseudomonadota bacterium]
MAWLIDPAIPLSAKRAAVTLARARMRIWWMRLDPWLVGTGVVLIVLLRFIYRAQGIETNPANLLTGTAVALLALAAGLGSLTKRSDKRQARVMERVLRMKGYRLTGPGRLERI